MCAFGNGSPPFCRIPLITCCNQMLMSTASALFEACDTSTALPVGSTSCQRLLTPCGEEWEGMNA